MRHPIAVHHLGLAEHRSGLTLPQPGWPGLLLAAERAVDIGSGIMTQGRRQIGALVPEGSSGPRHRVDLRIESAIRSALADDTPEISFLG